MEEYDDIRQQEMTERMNRIIDEERGQGDDTSAAAAFADEAVTDPKTDNSDPNTPDMSDGMERTEYQEDGNSITDEPVYQEIPENADLENMEFEEGVMYVDFTTMTGYKIEGDTVTEIPLSYEIDGFRLDPVTDGEGNPVTDESGEIIFEAYNAETGMPAADMETAGMVMDSLFADDPVMNVTAADITAQDGMNDMMSAADMEIQPAGAEAAVTSDSLNNITAEGTGGGFILAADGISGTADIYMSGEDNRILSGSEINIPDSRENNDMAADIPDSSMGMSGSISGEMPDTGSGWDSQVDASGYNPDSGMDMAQYDQYDPADYGSDTPYDGQNLAVSDIAQGDYSPDLEAGVLSSDYDDMYDIGGGME